MLQLGMPPGVMSAFCFTDGPINADQPETTIYLATADPAEKRAPRVDSKLLAGGNGYVLGMFGLLLDPQSTEVDWPAWIFKSEPPIIFEPWQMRAYKSDAPCRAQSIWRPGAERRFSVEFTSESWSDADHAATSPALRWLRDLEPMRPARSRGQPRRYTDANEPQFFEDLNRAAHAAVTEGEHVNISSLSNQLCAARRTITNAVNLFDYDLDAIEIEATHCTQRLNICSFLWRRRDNFKKKRE